MLAEQVLKQERTRSPKPLAEQKQGLTKLTFSCDFSPFDLIVQASAQLGAQPSVGGSTAYGLLLKV
jgi:hypothetical protein